MRAASTTLLTPAASGLSAAAIYILVGDVIGLGLALWFSWCMTRAEDVDHRWLRYLGWTMLVSITTLTIGRFALAD